MSPLPGRSRWSPREPDDHLVQLHTRPVRAENRTQALTGKISPPGAPPMVIPTMPCAACLIRGETSRE